MHPYSYPTVTLNRVMLAQGPAAAPAAPAAAAPGVPSGPTTGVKVVETLLTLGFTGAMAYTGIRVGLKENGTNSALGWMAGVGGGLLGLAGLAAIVSPPLAARINPFRFD